MYTVYLFPPILDLAIPELNLRARLTTEQGTPALRTSMISARLTILYIIFLLLLLSLRLRSSLRRRVSLRQSSLLLLTYQFLSLLADLLALAFRQQILTTTPQRPGSP